MLCDVLDYVPLLAKLVNDETCDASLWRVSHFYST